MMTDFLTATPESVGIPSESLVAFLQELEEAELPLHSFIVLRHNRIAFESYYAPYERNTFHRMFSVTKSFVSIAIGCLAYEGRISLDDRIVDYFPEKTEGLTIHPYLALLTIRQMLEMRTCYDSTTYKAKGVTDWVGSFFTTKPTHAPGTNWSYDTSSTHTLCALVEKLSGQTLLDYLRDHFLNLIGFSEDAYCLKDPQGISMGGSGLMCTPMDICRVMYVVSHDGCWIDGTQVLPEEYIRQAIVKQADTYAKTRVYDEMQGYGYQFWTLTHGAYAMYGMGGQLAVAIPDKDLIFVTTADTQGRNGGVEMIYQSFWKNVYPYLSDEPLEANTAVIASCLDYAESRTLATIPGYDSSPVVDVINEKTFVSDTSNYAQIKEFSFTFDGNFGMFRYLNATGYHIVRFGFGRNYIQEFADTGHKCAASAAFRAPETLVIKLQFVDESVGHLYIIVNFIENHATIMFNKIEESLFNEYRGTFSGTIKK